MKKQTNDPNLIAARIVSETTEPKEIHKKEKNPAAVALGHLGGLKGGRARAEKLTSRRRRAIAQKAAKARWEKNKPK